MSNFLTRVDMPAVLVLTALLYLIYPSAAWDALLGYCAVLYVVGVCLAVIDVMANTIADGPPALSSRLATAAATLMAFALPIAGLQNGWQWLVVSPVSVILAVLPWLAMMALRVWEYRQHCQKGKTCLS